MIPRKKTRRIRVGGVPVGGGAPISVQSMTNPDTRDAGATLAQIRSLAREGCEIVRVAVPDAGAARAFRRIDRGSGAKGNALWVRNVQENETVFRPIVGGFDDEMSVVENVGGGLLVVTDRGAPNRRLVQIDPERPAEEHWKVILPERRDPLQSATVIGGRIVATYTRDVTSRVFVYDLGGTVQHEVALPTLGSAAVADGFPADSSFCYSSPPLRSRPRSMNTTSTRTHRHSSGHPRYSSQAGTM